MQKLLVYLSFSFADTNTCTNRSAVRNGQNLSVKR